MRLIKTEESVASIPNGFSIPDTPQSPTIYFLRRPCAVSRDSFDWSTHCPSRVKTACRENHAGCPADIILSKGYISGNGFSFSQPLFTIAVLFALYNTSPSIRSPLGVYRPGVELSQESFFAKTPNDNLFFHE